MFYGAKFHNLSRFTSSLGEGAPYVFKYIFTFLCDS